MVSTSSTDVSAVQYERDADGIVTLILDDPTSSANTMNELYLDSMKAAVDRLYAEQDDVTGVVIASAKKTFFAGGNLKKMVQARPEDAPDVFAMGEAVKAGLRRLETFPRPVARRDQRRGARRWLRDLPGLQPPCDRGRPEGRGRPPRGVARPAARRRRRHPDGADARHPVRADGRAAAGHALQARAGVGEGPRRRARRHPRGAGARRQGVDQGQPRDGPEPLGRARLPDAGRYAEQPQARRRSCRRSRRCCASRPRARSTRPSGRSSRPPSRVHRSTSTPPRGSSRAT